MNDATANAGGEAGATETKETKEQKAARKAAEKAAAAQARADKKAAAKADKEKAKAEAKAASKQPEANGITRPKAGTITGKLWDTFDALSRETGVPATIGDSMKRSVGTAEATVRTQYARWRKFNGVTGRAAPAPVPAAPEASPSA